MRELFYTDEFERSRTQTRSLSSNSRDSASLIRLLDIKDRHGPIAESSEELYTARRARPFAWSQHKRDRMMTLMYRRDKWINRLQMIQRVEQNVVGPCGNGNDGRWYRFIGQYGNRSYLSRYALGTFTQLPSAADDSRYNVKAIVVGGNDHNFSASFRYSDEPTGYRRCDNLFIHRHTPRVNGHYRYVQRADGDSSRADMGKSHRVDHRRGDSWVVG